MLRAFVVAVLIVMLFPPIFAGAHDSWISKGGHRNNAGEWCCGSGDCAVMDKDTVGFTSRGYEIDGWGTIEGSGKREYYKEIVPIEEAQPSPDGAYWRCHRPDGSRRCFFAPPPNT
jgi:hypothetical protein